jgi:hypothetical protein
MVFFVIYENLMATSTMFECVGTMDEPGKAFFSQAIPQILCIKLVEKLEIMTKRP